MSERVGLACRLRGTVGVTVACLLLVGACTRGPGATGGSAVMTDDAITVGSFDFPESELLAEIYAQALTRAGFTVHRALDIGPRELVMPALQRGLVELIPEYQGSALAFLGGIPTADAGASRRALVRALATRGLSAAAPAPAQDQNTFAVTRTTAERLALRTLSDLTTTGGRLRLGGPAECPERPLCMQGLQDVYGARFASFVPLDAGGPITVQALRQGFVDVGELFTTSPALEAGDLTELTDDRHLQPAENVIAVYRPELVRRFGSGAIRALEAVSSPLSTGALRDMNAEVQGGRSISDVASAWVGAHPPPAGTGGGS